MSIIYFRLKFTLKKIIADSKLSPDFSYFKGIHNTFSPDSESWTRETKLGRFCSGLTNLRANGKTNPAPNFSHSWISFIVNLAWVILKGELIKQKSQKSFLQVWVQFPLFQRRTLVSQLAPTLLGLSAPWILRSLQLFPGIVFPEIPQKKCWKVRGNKSGIPAIPKGSHGISISRHFPSGWYYTLVPAAKCVVSNNVICYMLYTRLRPKG